MKKALLIFLVSFSLSACLDFASDPSPDPDDPRITDPKLSGLKSFDSCASLKNHIAKLVKKHKPKASPADGGIATADDTGTDSDTAMEEPVESPEAAPVTVEEADIVKHEGNRLYVVNRNNLLIYDVTDPQAPTELAQQALDFQAQELYATEDRVAVIGSHYDHDSYNYSALNTQVVLLSVSQAETTILKEWKLNGSYSKSRKVGQALYLAAQEYISIHDAEEWLEEKGDCSSIYLPESLAFDDYAVNAWHVTGLSLTNPDTAPDTMTVVGSWNSEITATPEHFYLTNLFYNDDETGIYLFDLNASAATLTPRAHALVPGRIVNQFSMDEHEGFFRIATTTNRSTFGADDNRNYMSVFKVNDTSMQRVGQTGSITPGESITAVRFLGEKAFLTTYVTKDPLLAMDLSDPSKPQVLSELDVPGYAHYLHSWGDYLISLGSTEEFWGEVILTLFDVSDLKHPKIIQQIALEGSAESEAQYDTQAFSFFEDQEMLALPVSNCSEGGSYLALYSIDPERGFVARGQIEHSDLVPAPEFNEEGDDNYYDDYYWDDYAIAPTMRRSLEIAGVLYTISDAGLKASSFESPEATLASQSFPESDSFDYWGGYGCYPMAL